MGELPSFSQNQPAAQMVSVKQQVLKSDLQEVIVFTQKMLRSDDPEKLEQLLARMNS